MTETADQISEKEVTVGEYVRVTYEGNDFEDIFDSLAEAESWASQWENAILHRRIVTTTVEMTPWEPVTSPAQAGDVHG